MWLPHWLVTTKTAFGSYGEYVIQVEPARQPDLDDLAEAYGYIFPGNLAQKEDLAWLPASAPERRSAAMVGYFSTLNVPVVARKTGLGRSLLSAWMNAVAPFNLEKVYLNSAPEDDSDAAWLDKFYESAGWRPIEPRRGPHRWFVYP